MEQKEQKAKVVIEVDGERKEFESGTVVLIVNDGKGTFTRAISRDGGEKFFELYRNTKELVEKWEAQEPALVELYDRVKEIDEALKKAGIDIDALRRGDDDE